MSCIYLHKTILNEQASLIANHRRHLFFRLHPNQKADLVSSFGKSLLYSFCLVYVYIFVRLFISSFISPYSIFFCFSNNQTSHHQKSSTRTKRSAAQFKTQLIFFSGYYVHITCYCVSIFFLKR